MNKQPACKINDIGYPSSDKITSRISTLRRSMACTLMNRDACTPEQEQVWLKYFPDNKCAYCGQEATHLDHLHPMVRDNEPTGFGTDPGNLVPCCKNCNTPKGNMAWEDFMRSSKCEHIAKPNKTIQQSINERIQNISDFQKVMPAQFTDINPAMKQQWKTLWQSLEQQLKNTEDMLLDMRRQLYGNIVSEVQKQNGSKNKATLSNKKSTSKNVSGSNSKDSSRYEFLGKTYGKSRLVLAVVQCYCIDKKPTSFTDLHLAFPDWLQGSKGVVRLSSQVSDKDKGVGGINRYFIEDEEIITLSNGDVVFVSNQWGGAEKMDVFIQYVMDHHCYVISKR